MRKRFEAEYPHNSKLAACEWCVLYHCYRVKPNPNRKPGNTGAKDEQAVAGLLQKFMDRKVREAYEALHPVPDGYMWDSTNAEYVHVLTLNEHPGRKETSVRLDADLESFTIGYQEMFETIYDEEVGL